MSTSFPVKSIFQNDCRRFKLDRPSFESLRQALISAYPQLPDEFVVKYTDDEGDNCLITADMELAEAAHVAELQKSPLKVLVFATKMRDLVSPTEEKKAQVQVEVEEEDFVRPEVEEEVLQEVKKNDPFEVSPKLEDSTPKLEAAPKIEDSTPKLEDSIPKLEDSVPKLDSKEESVFEEKEDLQRGEIIDLAFSLLKDEKIQPDIPQALEVALDTLRAGVEQGQISIMRVVDKVLATTSSLKQHPAAKKLLPHLRSCAPIVDNLLAQAKSYLPLLTMFIQQSISQIPYLISQIDFESLKACLLRKWEQFLQGGADFTFCGSSCDSEVDNKQVEPQRSEAVHENIKCDGCGQSPLLGARYKCTVCPDYDLCASCESKNLHPASHALLKLKEPRRNDVHHNIVCDGCEVTPIRGIRYKCATCPDFDLCAICEAKGQHPVDHPLIKMRVATKIEVSAHYDQPNSGCPGSRSRCPRSRSRCQEKKEDKKEDKKEFPALKKPVATFVRDVNLPDGAKVLPGAILMKSWEFNNPSSVQWPEGSKLIFLEGSRDLLASTEEFDVPRAAAGQTVEVRCPIQVPSKPGKYIATFQLATKERDLFDGHRCWVELIVTEEEKEQSKPEVAQSKPEVAQSKPEVAQPKPEVTQPKPVPSQPQPVVAQPKPQPKEQKQDPATVALMEKFKKELATLESMGFSNTQLNLHLLSQKYKGNIEQTVTWLLDMEKSR